MVLLCYWEGLTQEQAAVQLGCPIGTVRSRIARARDLLRRRLVRRGLAATAGAVAAFSTIERTGGPAACLGSPQSGPFLRGSRDVRRGRTGDRRGGLGECLAARPTRALEYGNHEAQERRRSWWLRAGLLALGAQLWAQQKSERPRVPAPRQHVAEGPKKPIGPIPRSQLAHLIDPPDLILVEVLEALPGRPISGERLVRPDGTISLGFYGDVEVAGLTVREAKEKIVQHMRKFLEDDVAGAGGH